MDYSKKGLEDKTDRMRLNKKEDLLNVIKTYKEKFNFGCGGKNICRYYRKDKMKIIDRGTPRYTYWYCPKCLR